MMMRLLLAVLAALAVGLTPALAQDPSSGPAIRTVAGKRPVNGDVPITATDTGSLPCIGTCADWPTFLAQLAKLVPSATDIDVRTAINDAPNGADYLQLQTGKIISSTLPGSLSMFVQNLYGLTSGQMAAIFQAAGAVRSPLQPYALPTLVQLGAAAVDLSNVNAATARAALGLGPLAAASTLAGLDASGANLTAAGSTTPLALSDVASRGISVTPQMFGAACTSNGTTGNGSDDTAALQAAMNYAMSSGLPLKIPSRDASHMCRTTAALDVNDRITIAGDDCKPYTDLSQLHPTPGPGSWLFFDHAGPGLFTNGHNPSGMVFRNFCTIRPQPPLVALGTWAPGAFDFDFSIAGDDSFFEHLVILNPTKAIFVEGRSTIRDIRGNPYQVGIQAYIDEDILRIQAIHFWPFDAINVAAANYQHANLEALQLYRVDNPMISDFFAIGASRCVHFMSNSSGFTSKAKFENLDCDLFGDTAVLDDADNVTAQFTNVTGQGVDPWGGSATTTANNLFNIRGANAHITADNVRSTNTGADGFVASGVGTWVLLHNYTAETWGINTGACAVSANNGATVNVDPSFYNANGAHGTCLYGGNGTVNSYSTSKVN